MAEVICDRVGPGLRESERIVTVKDVHGRREFLRVEQAFLTVVGDRTYLPVGIVQENPEQQLVLIELPQEGECGNWRLWVSSTDLLPHAQS
jgi:hypothetical protein